MNASLNSLLLRYLEIERTSRNFPPPPAPLAYFLLIQIIIEHLPNLLLVIIQQIHHLVLIGLLIALQLLTPELLNLLLEILEVYVLEIFLLIELID